jgi:hypothetical protein
MEPSAWDNIWKIVSKPDNVPIVAMLFLTPFFTVLACVLGRRNDRLRASGGEKAKDGRRRDALYAEAEETLPRRVQVWPYLLRYEMLAALLVLVLLMVWSITLDAPTEEPANPNLTPNPSKAPWYFLGLQELLVYFDPWIAGVVLPTLIIMGLMIIPYVDINPKGNGYYTLRERPFAILTFCFGFLVLWVPMIMIGTFVRGPGWQIFWPGEYWDAHRLVYEVNKDLTEILLAMPSNNKDWVSVPSLIGASVVVGYYAATMGAPWVALKKWAPKFLDQFGPVRYGITAFFFVTMLAVALKVVLRLTLTLKYVWVTPWFNI